MKVLVIFTCKFCNDGISNNIMNYFTYINHEHIKADFLCNNKDVPQKWIDKIESFSGRLFIIENRNRNPINYFVKLKKIIKKNKYDIVHVHGNSATMFVEVFAAKLAGCKIRIAHSRNSKCDHNFVHKILYPWFKLTYTDAFSCGELAGKWLFKNDKFEIIKNGNDTKRFKFDSEIRFEYRKQFSIKEDDIVILHVGFFVEQKNHEFLFKVIENMYKNNKPLNNFVFVLVGVGPLKNIIIEKYKDIIEVNRFIFLENRDDVNNLMSMADIFAFPSLFEGFPNVLVEAQISGLKIFASDKITIDANITNTVTFLSIDNNCVSLRSSLIYEFIPSNRTDVSTANINLIKDEGYDIEENAKILENKYEELFVKER